LLVARLTLTSAYVELGRDPDARLSSGRDPRISAHYSVASWPGVKDNELTDRFSSDLRKARLK
jgi:hypothetical protein